MALVGASAASMMNLLLVMSREAFQALVLPARERALTRLVPVEEPLERMMRLPLRVTWLAVMESEVRVAAVLMTMVPGPVKAPALWELPVKVRAPAGVLVMGSAAMVVVPVTL